ncbi:MAG: FkbM family methyltransferase [Vicinamibacterales bacterium]
MRFLFVAKQKKNVDTFETTIAELLARGHAVTLAIQQRDVERDRRLTDTFSSARFTLVSCPEERGDGWRRAAPLVRSTRDWAHYFQPSYARAAKLHQRAQVRLLRELATTTGGHDPILPLPATSGARLRAALAHIELTIPSDPLHEEFLRRHTPDAVLVSPGLHFGSGQSDFIKSAQALGIPVWMLLFSWDNLSTKGALHVAPDRMFVWNARQVREAQELHDYPAARVEVIGAPRFDEFFSLRSVISRDAFFAPLKLDPRKPTILYLCSSKFIAAEEPAFIATWLASLRSSESDALRSCNVVVRPHPDVPFEPDGAEPPSITWGEIPQATGWAHSPFADPRAVVLRTTYGTPQAFYECLHHADAVVALNTSAELEAGIAGRPVFTVLATGDAADGQAHTLHFEYLLRDHGGFVQYAPDLATHLQHLAETLNGPHRAESIKAFVMDFLRPHGDRPVAPLLASALLAAHASASASADKVGAQTVSPAAPQQLEPDFEVRSLSEPLPIKKLKLEGAPGVQLFATHETRRFRGQGQLRIDPVVSAWMEDVVTPGDVFYDVGAGIGTYSLLAALTRGALAVAFEPGFLVFRTLSENVRLNGASHGVIPLPIALSDSGGLFELEFSGPAGGEHHVLRNREWRPRREADDSRQGQPVCAERLDEVVARYGVPPPAAIRINVRREAARVLAGATGLLSGAGLHSILITMGRRDDIEDLAATARQSGFDALALGGSDDFGFSVRLDRSASAGAGVWDRLKAVVTRRPDSST